MHTLVVESKLAGGILLQIYRIKLLSNFTFRSVVQLKQSTLLVLIDFRPVWSESLSWSFAYTKTFDILPEIIMEYRIQA